MSRPSPVGGCSAQATPAHSRTESTRSFLHQEFLKDPIRERAGVAFGCRRSICLSGALTVIHPVRLEAVCELWSHAEIYTAADATTSINSTTLFVRLPPTYPLAIPSVALMLHTCTVPSHVPACFAYSLRTLPKARAVCAVSGGRGAAVPQRCEPPGATLRGAAGRPRPRRRRRLAQAARRTKLAPGNGVLVEVRLAPISAFGCRNSS
jgi:hypothetical protein